MEFLLLAVFIELVLIHRILSRIEKTLPVKESE